MHTRDGRNWQQRDRAAQTSMWTCPAQPELRGSASCAPPSNDRSQIANCTSGELRLDSQTGQALDALCNAAAPCVRHKRRGADDLFHVRFAFDRTPFRRMHAALAFAAAPPVLQLLPDEEEPLDGSRLRVRNLQCSLSCGNCSMRGSVCMNMPSDAVLPAL